MEAPLVGTVLHGFSTLEQLVNSLCWAFAQRRWLLNEEKLAMILNPQTFLWPGPDPPPFVDSDMLIDGFFCLARHDQYVAMGAEAGAPADLRHWFTYKEPDVLTEEKDCGITKNRRGNPRAFDAEEITLKRMEVKGRMRVRRRSHLLSDFEERAGFPAPNPAVYVLEYQLLPLSAKENRPEAVAQLDEQLVHLDPIMPLGILPHLPPPEAPVGPGGYRSGRGRLTLAELNQPEGAGTHWWGADADAAEGEVAVPMGAHTCSR